MRRHGDIPSWDDEGELWEHQGDHLTVGQLGRVLTDADDGLPFLVAVYDGSEGTPLLHPVELGFVGAGEQPDALVLTVATTAGSTG